MDDLVVTEQLISTILETPVSEQLFLEQLQVSVIIVAKIRNDPILLLNKSYFNDHDDRCTV